MTLHIRRFLKAVEACHVEDLAATPRNAETEKKKSAAEQLSAEQM